MIDIDECQSEPCSRKSDTSVCRDYVNAYTCDCDRGWMGKDCKTDINECENDQCLHGSCRNKPGGFECRCDRGYTGELCEVDIKTCDSDPCGFNGSCSEENGRYKCTCREGFLGRYCDKDFKDDYRDFYVFL